VFPFPYVILDLETTDGTPLHDRIIEIALIRFDYGFLKNEHWRIGAPLQHKVLCTARLSRKLYPQHKDPGLDAIMQRHGLTTERAIGNGGCGAGRGLSGDGEARAWNTAGV
jgi:DNA polymerase III epsilon subunit-like protein